MLKCVLVSFCLWGAQAAPILHAALRMVSTIQQALYARRARLIAF